MVMAHAAGAYEGENNLHILAVNRREDAFCRLLKLATSRLQHQQLTTLLTATATGHFFHSPPMAFYGGTPMAYTVCFGLVRPIDA